MQPQVKKRQHTRKKHHRGRGKGDTAALPEAGDPFQPLVHGVVLIIRTTTRRRGDQADARLEGGAGAVQARLPGGFGGGVGRGHQARDMNRSRRGARA